MIPAEVPSQNSPGILVGNALSGPDKPGRRLIELFRWVPFSDFAVAPAVSFPIIMGGCGRCENWRSGLQADGQRSCPLGSCRYQSPLVSETRQLQPQMIARRIGQILPHAKVAFYGLNTGMSE